MSELTADIEDHQLQRRRRRQVTAGAVVSVALHLALLAVFLFGLPEFPEKQEEHQQAVQVALVPPPEKTPAPPKAEEKPEEQTTPPKPAPKPQTPPPGQPKQATRIPIPVLNPAYRFGDKDAGPKKAFDGDAARKLETADAKPEDKPQETAGGKPAPSEAEKKAADPKPKPLPQTLTAAKSGADAKSTEEAVAALVPPAEDEKKADAAKGEAKPDEKAEDAAKLEDAPDLKRAGKLYSNSDTTAEEAMIAANGIAPSERASRLCVTELREQLRHGDPSYQPELLPAYNLPSGTVLAVRKAAFRAEGQWFDLSFRCEVDKDATRVVSFAYAVGDPVPRAKWKERGFPAF
ncbi:DUF930 domain-containing protein [Rhizobium sp. NRK18]|uniref:DUF930 domain-containing protein n=1 Tax=Rhizobium sp. NRK18 TaxID=2964667 RepID=UPI0021C2776F|nr:DUF930 domain-containing protein [Rhizobium sp. NRK18]MCQ2003681.1 DUF930 domain-containing protein [Rhizobium sp. NRK18]